MPADQPTDTFVRLRAAHAELAREAHVGVLVPWGNTIVEAELPRLGLDRLILHYARLVPARRYRDADAFLTEIAQAVPGALGQFARLRLAGTVVACTSTGFLAADAYRDAPVVDAFDALQATLGEFEATGIVLATPYPKRHTAVQAAALESAGFTVLGHASLDLGLLDDFTAVPAQRIADLVAEAHAELRSAPDAVVLSCTAWPTIAATALLQSTYGIPVISSNLALAYSALRLAQAAEVR
jgi:maleate cis-trans isomerase